MSLLPKLNTLVSTTVYAGCSKATKKCPTQCRTLTPKRHEFSAQKHAEKTPQIPKNFQQVSAAGTSRFWTLGEAADAEKFTTADLPTQPET